MGGRRFAIATLGGLLLLALAAVWWTVREPARDEAGARAPSGQVEAGDARRGRRIDAATVARAAIVGTVRDKAGAPVAAQVCGQAASDHLTAEDIRDPVCATSGPDGRYRLSGLLPASYSVDAAARGFIPASYRDEHGRPTFDVSPGEERHGIDLLLQPGGVELTGFVRDIGGGPVEGAWVKGQFTLSVALQGTARTRSLADGRFRLWLAPGQVFVVAQADGYADGWASARTPGPTVEVLLTPESTLSGRVVHAGTGAPVPGARVTSAGAGDWSPDSVGVLSDGILADDQGRFRLTRLPPGRYKPVATSPGGHGQARESVLLGLGQSVDRVLIELHPAASVTGRILVAGSETPCPAGWVNLTDTRRERYVAGAVERDKPLAIEGVLPGRYKVQIHCAGFVAEEHYPDVVVAAGETPAEQRWTVRAGGRIRGTVRASAGTPVENASVLAMRHAAEGNRPSGHGGVAATDAEGRFEIAGLPSGAFEVSVIARDQPAMSEPVPVTVSEGGDATVDIRLDVGGDLLGDVVDEKGHPVAGITLQAQAESSGRHGWTTRWSVDQSGQAETADDGSFAMRGLRPGPYHLSALSGPGFEPIRVRSPGLSDADGSAERVEVPAGAAVRRRLVVDSNSGVIRGRVVDGRGQAITDALVDAEPESEWDEGSGSARDALRFTSSRRPILTDTDGRFAIEKLRPGKYTLHAYRRGGGDALAQNVPVGADIVLTIRPTGSIAGRVVSDGAVPEEMTIVLANRQTAFSRRERFYRTAGEFAFRELPPGSFELSVRADEGTGDAQTQLTEGQNLTGLVVRLVGRATLTGRVLSLDEGKPLPGYQIQIEPLGRSLTMMIHGGHGYGSTGQDGRFVIEDVPVGRVRVEGMPPDFMEDARYSPIRRIVELQPGRTTDLGDVRLAPIRVRQDRAPGDLGFDIKREAADVETEQPATVALVRADGPAARSGLAVGDVIVSVDGYDVRGDQMLFWALCSVSPETTVTLGLARGASVRITAAEQPR